MELQNTRTSESGAANTLRAIEVAGDRPAAIHDYWIAIKKRAWPIGLIVALTTSSAYVLSTRLTPMYEAVATVELERESPSGVVGEQATRTAYFPDDDLFMATQLKLMQVDEVIRPVALKFGVPARGTLAPQSGSPIELPGLKVARVPNTRLLQVRYRSDSPAQAADVANGICQGYLDTYYVNRIRSMQTVSQYAQRQLKEIKAKMERSSLALAQYERDLKLVNPEQKTTLAAERVMQINAELTKVQAERIRREAEFNLAQNPTLDAAQASSLSEPLQKLVERRNEAQEKFSQIREHYGSEHPEYRKAAAQVGELDRQVEVARQSVARRHSALFAEATDRERMVEGSLRVAKVEADTLNQKSFGYQRLRNEAEADRKLYEQLTQRVNEADINSAFRNDAIRIVDPARAPAKPVSPNVPLNLALAFCLSAAAAIGGAITIEKTKSTVANASEAGQAFEVDILAELPIVKCEPVGRRVQSSSLGLLPAAAPLISDDRSVAAKAYVEGIRTLRNRLALANSSPRLRTVLVTSAVAGEGKTTTAIHAAVMNAVRGHATLLIDADFRRPSVHRVMNLPNRSGLATYVAGSDDWQAHIVHTPGLDALDIITAGAPNSATIDRACERLATLLDSAVAKYSLVVIDCPPALGCSDAAAFAALSDAVVLTVQARSTTRLEVRAALDNLRRSRANVIGLVMNKVRADEGSSFASYQYYEQLALAE